MPRRARGRDWTLGKLDRGQGWYLYWNEAECRWSIEAARVVLDADGEATLQLDQAVSR